MSAALVAACALAGCGGSSSSSGDRSKLLSQLSSALSASGVPADLSSCVSQQAQSLPTPQLRALAESAGPASTNSPPATKQLAARLTSQCVAQGKGVDVLHRAIVGSIIAQAPSNLPPAFTNCLVQKANTLSPATLSGLIGLESQGQAVVQAQARQLGVGLAAQCVTAPGVIGPLRAAFVDPIKAGFATSKFSAAFKNCVLAKAESIPASQLSGMIVNPAGANAAGNAFGQQAAKACVAQGAKP